MKKKWLWLPLGCLGLLLLGFAVIQLIPYGRNHVNPVVVLEPSWDSPQTRELAQRTCLDCHSNETVWPWYSNIAPVSWLIQHDVDEGRQRLNLSEWDKYQNSGASREIIEVIQEGIMPPAVYLPMHPEARLTEQEKQSLIDGFRKTLP